MRIYSVDSEDIERIYEYFIKIHIDKIKMIKYSDTKEWKEHLMRNIDNIYNICKYCNIPIPKWFDNKYHLLWEKCLKQYGIKIYYVPVE